MPRTLSLATLALGTGLVAQQPVDPGSTARTTFQNLNRTFQLELPAGWRQLAPNEARQLGESASTPPELRLSQPHHFYAVGPVEQWLRGDLSGPWLYVVEQQDEWHVDDDYAAVLRDSWRQQSETSGIAYDLRDIHREKLGSQRVECVVATRTTTPPAPAAVRRSLDVHAPAGSQQITLSFSCSPERFERCEPRFRAWLHTLAFARAPREQGTLGDRLWTPILVGGAVGIVLLLIYRHGRRRRIAGDEGRTGNAARS